MAILSIRSLWPLLCRAGNDVVEEFIEESGAGGVDLRCIRCRRGFWDAILQNAEMDTPGVGSPSLRYAPTLNCTPYHFNSLYPRCGPRDQTEV